MSSQIRRIEIKQRRTRKKKVAKLRAKYESAAADQKQRIEQKLQRVAYATPTTVLLETVRNK